MSTEAEKGFFYFFILLGGRMSCIEGQSRVSGTLKQPLSATSAGVGVCGDFVGEPVSDTTI